MKYNGTQYVIRTLRYCLKTSTKLTKYFNSMYSESHMWLNAGIEARRAGLSVFDTMTIATLLQTIPQAWVRGAIQEGHAMEGCSHVKYGSKIYPLYSAIPLGKKSKDDVVYLPRCNMPFKLQKGCAGRLFTANQGRNGLERKDTSWHLHASPKC